MSKLTPDDLHQLRFFWEDGKSLTRYYRWEEIQDDLERNHPEITQAYRTLIAARRTMDAVLKQASAEAEIEES